VYIIYIFTSKACTERRLLLARTLGDMHGKGDAYLQLGSLAQVTINRSIYRIDIDIDIDMYLDMYRWIDRWIDR